MRSLAKNSIYNVMYRLLNVAFPLVTATYIARILLAGGVGRVATAQNIVTYFTMLAILGIPNYGTREISKLNMDPANRSKLFSELISINFCSTLLCLLAYYLLIFCTGLFDDEIRLYSIVGLTVFFNFFNVEWFYQGVEDYGFILRRSLAIKIITLVCILIFVKRETDVLVYAILYTIGIGGNHLLNIIRIKKYNIVFSLDGLEIKKHIKPILILTMSVIAIELYTLVDVTMISFICGEKNVAYYTNSMKLVKVVIGVVAAIGGVLLPRLSYYRSQGEIDECSRIVTKTFYILLLIFAPCEIGMFIVAKQLVPFLFGASFVPAVNTLRIASWLICTLGFSNLFGTQVLLSFGEEKRLLRCTVCAAISNIILNCFLIPRYSQEGATIASVISETLVTVMAVFYSLKHIKLYFDKRFFISLVIALICMTGAVVPLQFCSINDTLRLFLSGLVGLITYIMVCYVMKNTVLLEMISYLKKRIAT